jgi:hypothetical protein
MKGVGFTDEKVAHFNRLDGLCRACLPGGI